MMADRAFFGFVGAVLGGVTVMVSTVALIVVVGQISGYFAGL